MPSNSLLHFITKVIDLEEVQVVNYHFITDHEILIELKNTPSKRECPHCGKPTDKLHQNHGYRVRDIPLMGYKVFLKINRRQFKCKSCQKVFSEELKWVKKRRTYTKRLGKKVVKEVLETNGECAAERNQMTPAEVETLLKELEEELLSKKPPKIKRLGIDEITQLKGGKNYAAVLVDLETRKPIALLEKRNKETIAKYLSSLGLEVLEQIEEIQKNLPELGKMYTIKEEFRDIFESQITSDEAFHKLVDWGEKSHQHFPKSCQTIRRWMEPILAYFNHRTTQGVVEGINQKIKLIKRRAYGLTNFDNFRRRVLLNWYYCA